MRPRLGREGSTISSDGHVGHIRGQDRDPAAQPGGQRGVQVALVDAAAREVLPGAADRGRVNVGRMQRRDSGQKNAAGYAFGRIEIAADHETDRIVVCGARIVGRTLRQAIECVELGRRRSV